MARTAVDHAASTLHSFCADTFVTDALLAYISARSLPSSTRPFLLQPLVWDEGGHGGLVLLDNSGGERRCSSSFPTSTEERSDISSTPRPCTPFFSHLAVYKMSSSFRRPSPTSSLCQIRRSNKCGTLLAPTFCSPVRG